ncbi:unknown protein [Waddlia chondrophila 2032/99]|uniref:Uncharacterized protein n=1 Tax=Waddlia chondrophila 2032/99 TaxID=765953 RepID=F8LDW0_9BACT|nr:unknown protein [Waddlia chondrophila 2032/99]
MVLLTSIKYGLQAMQAIFVLMTFK